MRKYKGLIVFATWFTVLLIADLLTKHFVAANLAIGQYLAFIPRVLGITYHYNDGMAFGWFSGGRPWLIAISIVMIVGAAIFYWFHKRKPRHILFDIAFAFFFAGALGNLVDRIFIGAVRDFLFFEFWANSFIFNLADVWLNISVVLIVVYFILLEGGEYANRRRERQLGREVGQPLEKDDGGGLDTEPNNQCD